MIVRSHFIGGLLLVVLACTSNKRDIASETNPTADSATVVAPDHVDQTVVEEPNQKLSFLDFIQKKLKNQDISGYKETPYYNHWYHHEVLQVTDKFIAARLIDPGMEGPPSESVFVLPIADSVDFSVEPFSWCYIILNQDRSMKSYNNYYLGHDNIELDSVLSDDPLKVQFLVSGSVWVSTNKYAGQHESIVQVSVTPEGICSVDEPVVKSLKVN